MTTPSNTYRTREEWLHAFTNQARPIFADIGAPLPFNIRISVGMPSKGWRSKSIGECFFHGNSADGHYEIFLNPMVKKNESPLSDARMADILTHELIHTVVFKDGHGAAFRKIATDLGLGGKMTATIALQKWYNWAAPIIERLGPMPYAEIRIADIKPKKTYQHKVECPECGWYGMVNAKWITPHEYLTCPVPDCETEMIVHGLKN